MSQSRNAAELSTIGRHERGTTPACLGCNQDVIGSNRRTLPAQMGPNIAGVLGILRIAVDQRYQTGEEARQHRLIALRSTALRIAVMHSYRTMADSRIVVS
jgi:hypothetical protein